MSSSQFPLRQSGIYRNLPTFDPSLRDLKALVLGATSISGFHTIRALLDSTHRWSKVMQYHAVLCPRSCWRCYMKSNGHASSMSLLT